MILNLICLLAMILSGCSSRALKITHSARWQIHPVVKLMASVIPLMASVIPLTALVVALMTSSLSVGFAQNTDKNSSASPRVDKLRIWHSPDSTRVVFDVSADVKHSVFSLINPNRVVVDIDDTSLQGKIPSLDPNNAHIAAIRTGRPRKGVLRFVFELKKVLKQQNFVLSPNELYLSLIHI